MDARAAQEKSIVEMLATWGATARPEMADLFDVLLESGGHESLDLLTRLLASPVVAGNKELKRELEGLVSQAKAGGNGSAFTVRLRETLGRCRGAIKPGIDASRGKLAQELLPWSPLIPRDRLDPLLAKLWRSERVDSVDEQLSGLTALDEARELLGSARQAAEKDLRSALESEIPAETRALVDGALKSGDPISMASARESLQGKLKQDAAAGRAEELAGARNELDATVSKAEAALAGGKLDGRASGLLGAAVTGARSALEDSGDSAETLSFWQAAIEAMLGGGASQVATDEERIELARGIVKELRERGGSDGAGIDALERDLVQAGSAGDAVFFAKLLDGFKSVRSMEEESSRRAEEAAEQLRKSSDKLGALLEKSAGALPTEQVVAARLLLDDVDVRSGGGDPVEIEELGHSIDDSVEELTELAAKIRRSMKSREAAEKERLEDEIQSLLPVADAGTRRELQALGGKVGQASPERLREARTRLDQLRSRVEGGVRLSAALTLERCEKKKDAQLKSQAGKLRAALAKDDLAGAAKLTDEIAGGVGGVPKPAGPMPAVVLAVLILVVPLGGLFGWQMMSGGSKSYQVQLRGEAISAGTTVSVVRDGAVVERQGYTPGGVSFDLSPGSYEIFVNGRYTGRVIESPGDPGTIDDIPAPAE